MSDVPLSRATVLWRISKGSYGPPVKVVDVASDDRRYVASAGACDVWFQNADQDGKLEQLLNLLDRIISEDGVPFELVDEALSVIPEYRDRVIEE